MSEAAPRRARIGAVAVLLAAVLCGAVIAVVAQGGGRGGPVVGAAPSDDTLSDRHGKDIPDRLKLQLASLGVGRGRLTIDSGLQQHVERVLDRGLVDLARRQKLRGSHPTLDASIVVVDLADRSFAAMASTPGEIPAFAVEAQPGSTVKPLVALAALQAGVADAEDRYPCPRRYAYREGLYPNWRPSDQPDMTVSRAIADSCNTVFYGFAARLWDARTASDERTPIETTLRRFGLGSPTGVFPGDRPGFFPRAAATDNELLTASLGTGTVRATPIQMARAYTALVNGKPTAIRDLWGVEVPPVGVQVSREEMRPIRDGMQEVVREGTAAPAFADFPFTRLAIGGKTGTARQDAATPVSWFAGFAPVEHPRYLVVVLVKGMEPASGVAAPIGREVFDDLLVTRPRALGLGPTVRPHPVVLAVIAMTLFAGLLSAPAGAMVGGLAGVVVDGWAGLSPGPSIVSLALGGWIVNWARRKVPLPFALAAGALAGTTLRLGAGVVFAEARPAWTVELASAAVTAGLACLVGLAITGVVHVLARRRDVDATAKRRTRRGARSPKPATPRRRSSLVLRWGIVGAVFVALAAGITAQAASWPDVKSVVSGIPRTTAFIEHARSQASARHSDPVEWAWVPYEQISKEMRLAVLVGEDTRFFFHGGLDWVEVRDSLQDAIQKRAAPRGASTITQQLARNLWLSPSRNPLRKMKEMVLAVQLERSLSKERILELYLNVAQFGPSQFGVEAAARRFFSKPAAELSELEAAQLAAALPAASSWYPGSESEAYQERIDAIISRMHADTWLTDWI